MATIPEIQEAIIGLAKDDYRQLRRWLIEYDWDAWDKQIEADSDSGKLDDLVSQASDSKRDGTLKDL